METSLSVSNLCQGADTSSSTMMGLTSLKSPLNKRVVLHEQNPHLCPWMAQAKLPLPERLRYLDGGCCLSPRGARLPAACEGAAGKRVCASPHDLQRRRAPQGPGPLTAFSLRASA